MQTVFPSLWWMADLGKVRDCDSTYCGYDFSKIPLLDMSLFKGDFAWLSPLNAKRKKAQLIYQRPEAREPMAANLKSLQQKIALPAEFTHFMSSQALQDEIPSCTAAYFVLSGNVVKNPLDEESHFIKFLSGQQENIFWYLFLQNGEHCVTVSLIDMEFDIADHPYAFSTVPKDIFQENVFVCASSFESFIYRFWLENTLWYALYEDDALTEAHRQYLAFYGK